MHTKRIFKNYTFKFIFRSFFVRWTKLRKCIKMWWFSKGILLFYIENSLKSIDFATQILKTFIEPKINLKIEFSKILLVCMCWTAQLHTHAIWSAETVGDSFQSDLLYIHKSYVFVTHPWISCRAIMNSIIYGFALKSSKSWFISAGIQSAWHQTDSRTKNYLNLMCLTGWHMLYRFQNLMNGDPLFFLCVSNRKINGCQQNQEKSTFPRKHIGKIDRKWYNNEYTHPS